MGFPNTFRTNDANIAAVLDFPLVKKAQTPTQQRKSSTSSDFFLKQYSNVPTQHASVVGACFPGCIIFINCELRDSRAEAQSGVYGLHCVHKEGGQGGD